MLKIFVSLILGPFGLKILDFYINHSGIINSIIFIYGAFLVISHINYQKILDAQMNKIRIEKNNQKNRIEKYSIDWQKGINGYSKFPWVAGGTSILPKKTSVKNIKEIVKRDKKWQKLTDGIQITEKD